MNILDGVCVILIIASVIMCTVKGYKKVVFKAAAFAIAMLAAKLTGYKIDIRSKSLVK